MRIRILLLFCALPIACSDREDPKKLIPRKESPKKQIPIAPPQLPGPELPPETRQKILRLLGECANSEVDDQRAKEVRHQLVQMGPLASEWLLSQMLATDRAANPFRDEDILEILQGMNANHLVPLCLDLLGRVDASRRRLLADLLQKIGTPDLAAPLVDIVLGSHTERSIRMTCARLLIHFREPNSVHRLIQAAHTPDHPAASTAVYILGQIRVPEALPVLLEVLQLGHDPQTPPDALTDPCRTEAAQALARIGLQNRSVIDALCRSARNDPALSVRVRAVEALETLAPDTARKRLGSLREDPHSAVRAAVERLFEGS